jgi:bifunctional aspartokinase / homoserine dehydrogenase 1
MKVLKFGGSSVANAQNIERAVEIIKAALGGGKTVAVFSALQSVTDRLIEAGRMAECGDDGFIEKLGEIENLHTQIIEALFPDLVPAVLDDFIDFAVSELESIYEGVLRVRELSGRTLDRILSFGELVSSQIASAKLKAAGVDNQWVDVRLLIRTDQNHGFAAVNFVETSARIAEYFASGNSGLYVLPGFVASGPDGATTTLGRGGSDYTAAIVAAALDAEVLEIWTDVSGMMTADPRFVRNARHISRINYREAMELSHFGAKVIYPPTIQPVMAKSIPLWIKNSFAPEEPGTLIEAETDDTGGIIRGITSIDNIAVLSLEGSGMVGIPGFSKRLFDALSRSQINVILITQSSSEHSICVAIEETSAALAKATVDREFESEIGIGKIEPLKVEAGFSILALVGDNMRSHTGISGKMFTALGHNGINIHAIAQGSSERNISAIIASADVRKAVNTLHEEFFSDGNKQINLFIAGVGTVGRRLLEQIAKQSPILADSLRLNLRVVGITNSRRRVIDDEGLSLADLDSQLETGEASDINRFTDAVNEMNLRNSIFVDVTASPRVVEAYPKLLERSVSIVACNKIACSSDLDTYNRLISLAREYNANFLYETNVGAGLPVINTLNDLTRSGDRIRRIEAVLSGTLNFVFNNYDGSRPFADVVRQAQDEGYTEPDPRLDLNGTDVARKILILSRESGYRLEMNDIKNSGFLPESCLAGSVDSFYADMLRNEAHFRKLFDDAFSNGLTLKYIASLDNGEAAVGLQSIGSEHNFANLSGKDNAVLFYTDRYSEQPLVIKGAGAGADVTAAGVFADIIRAARI